jgi:hypothetical protein
MRVRADPASYPVYVRGRDWYETGEDPEPALVNEPEERDRRPVKLDGNLNLSNVHKTFAPLDGYGRPYGGDGYDQKLDAIYKAIMTRSSGAGGYFPRANTYVQTLPKWTKIWLRRDAGNMDFSDEEGAVVYAVLVKIQEAQREGSLF